MEGQLTVIQYLIGLLFNFTLPGIAISFGSLIVAVFGLPILVRAFRKLF